MQDNKGHARLPAAMTLLMALLAVSLSTSAQVEEAGPMIRLQRATFDPLAGEPALPRHLRMKGYPDGVRGYYLVQFKEPVREEWKRELEKLGDKLFDYIPDFAFIVRTDEPTKAQIQKLPFVRWVGLYHPTYKLHQDFDEPTREMVPVVIQTFPGEDLGAFLEAVKSLRASVSGFPAPHY